MNKLSFFAAIASIIFASCAKSIQVPYQSSNENTGTLILKPTNRTFQTYVTIDDSLLVDRVKVKELTITHLPAGEHQVHYSSNSASYKENIDARLTVQMEQGREITKIVEVPPYSTGYWVSQAIGSASIFALLFLIDHDHYGH